MNTNNHIINILITNNVKLDTIKANTKDLSRDINSYLKFIVSEYKFLLDLLYPDTEREFANKIDKIDRIEKISINSTKSYSNNESACTNSSILPSSNSKYNFILNSCKPFDFKFNSFED